MKAKVAKLLKKDILNESYYYTGTPSKGILSTTIVPATKNMIGRINDK